MLAMGALFASVSPPPPLLSDALRLATRSWIIQRAGDGLEAAFAWDSAAGQATLRLATALLLRPTARVVTSAGALDLSPDPNDDEIVVKSPIGAVHANVTRVRMSGLASIGPFASLTPVGAALVEASSSFGTLDTHVHIRAAVHTLGVSRAQSLLLTANLSNVSLSIVWRCALRRGALSAATLSRQPLLHRRSLSLAIDSVRVRISGGLSVSVDADDSSGAEAGGHERGVGPPWHGTGHGVPRAAWRLVSHALSSVLKQAVEEHAGAAIHRALSELVRDADDEQIAEPQPDHEQRADGALERLCEPGSGTPADGDENGSEWSSCAEEGVEHT